MIDPRELRIGNWFHHNKEWCYKRSDHADPNIEINEFDFQWEDRDWYALGESTLFIENISPIELTPDWLIRAGFKDCGEYFLINQDDGDKNFTFQRYDDTQAKVFWRGRYLGICQRLQYVHQLQNIYFALTGKELDFKPIDI